MWDIFKSIRNNKKVKPKWIMGKLKDLLEKPIYLTRFKKQIHQKKISRDIGSFCKEREEKLGKVKDYVK